MREDCGFNKLYQHYNFILYNVDIYGALVLCSASIFYF